MKNIAIYILALIPSLGFSSEIPHGWEITSSQQYAKEDISWFKGMLPNKVTADFNGDGITDTAWLLTNSTKTKLGLFVSISSSKKTYKIIKLFEDTLNGNIYMGISHLSPGIHKTACGKGYWECTKEEKPFLNLKNSAISFFKFESASSIYYWNKTKFQRVWLSD